MKKLFYCCLLSIITGFCSYSISQERPGVISGAPRQYMGTLQSFQKIRKLLNNPKKDNPVAFKDIQGSPYLNEDFKEGKIYIQDSLLSYGMFRYNIYADEIEISENNQLYGLLKIKQSKILIGDQTIVLLEYPDNKNQLSKEYFIIIVDDKPLQLLKKMRCILSPAQKAPTPNQKDRAAKFTTYSDYYIKNDLQNQNPLKLQLKRKNILMYMSDQKEKIKNYINTEDINLKNEDDLKKLFVYYNNLQIK